jgi:hypothetical protein
MTVSMPSATAQSEADAFNAGFKTERQKMPAHVEDKLKVHSTSERTQRASMLTSRMGLPRVGTDNGTAANTLLNRGQAAGVWHFQSEAALYAGFVAALAGESGLHRLRPGWRCISLSIRKQRLQC